MHMHERRACMCMSIYIHSRLIIAICARVLKSISFPLRSKYSKHIKLLVIIIQGFSDLSICRMERHVACGTGTAHG